MVKQRSIKTANSYVSRNEMAVLENVLVNESINLTNRSKKESSSRRGAGRQMLSQGENTSDASKSLTLTQRPRPVLSPDEKTQIQKESKAIIWEQNRSLFVAGKTRDHIFNKTRMNLARVSFQP